MNESSENTLTPRRAAEVIRYFDNGVNAEARAGEWKAQKPLVLMAIQTTLEVHSFLPDGEPLLTFDEAAVGFMYLVNEARRKLDDEGQE